MKRRHHDKMTSSSYSSTDTAVGSSVSMPIVISAISASVMASLLIYLHLHRQLLQDSNSGSDCKPVLTHPSPCGLPVPKATIKLGNTGENVELIMFSFFLGLY